MSGPVTVAVSTDEVAEALEVLRSWSGRVEQVPEHLKREIIRLAAAPDVLRLEGSGAYLEIAASPELRALVANLRIIDRR
jgi:hypothetical protein